MHGTAEQLFDKPAWSKSAFGAGSNVKIHALTNHVMRDGKKGQAEKIVRDMTQTIQRLTGEDPALVIETAFEKCTPLMDTRTSKRGNRRFEIPMGLYPWIARFGSTSPMPARALRWLRCLALCNVGGATRDRGGARSCRLEAAECARGGIPPERLLSFLLLDNKC